MRVWSGGIRNSLLHIHKNFMICLNQSMGHQRAINGPSTGHQLAIKAVNGQTIVTYGDKSVNAMP